MENTTKIENWILKRLPEPVVREVLSAAEFTHLDVGEDVLTPHKTIEFVDFPETGVISIVNEGKPIVEIATVGREGFVGTSLLLGITEVSERAFCQVEATCWRLQSKDFLHLTNKYPEFLQRCHLSTQALHNQVVNNMVCNQLHSVEERCARWLLTTEDRSAQNSFYLTQEFLGQMLNVARGRVNLIAGVFQSAGVISYVRGKITILDRPKLEEISCPCHKKIRSYTEQLLVER